MDGLENAEAGPVYADFVNAPPPSGSGAAAAAALAASQAQAAQAAAAAAAGGAEVAIDQPPYTEVSNLDRLRTVVEEVS